MKDHTTYYIASYPDPIQLPGPNEVRTLDVDRVETQLLPMLLVKIVNLVAKEYDTVYLDIVRDVAKRVAARIDYEVVRSKCEPDDWFRSSVTVNNVFKL